VGVTAVIAAAGSGERLGAGGPKAFVPLAGRPMIEWSLDAMRRAEVAAIVVAVPSGGASAGGNPQPTGRIVGSDWTYRPAAGDPPAIVEGGATRSESVANALVVVETELVAIHDAARPLLTADLLRGVVATLEADSEAAGAIAATPVTDTIKLAARSSHKFGTSEMPNIRLGIEETVDRDRLWAAQTPQVFRAAALREAIAGFGDESDSERGSPLTDEAMALERAGARVLIHPAPPENLKVTTRLDLLLAERLLAERSAQ
jgi:2-C-methyl-D-erythritol 4-phosphate cytidylyltransferase